MMKGKSILPDMFDIESKIFHRTISIAILYQEETQKSSSALEKILYKNTLYDTYTR